MRTEHIISLHPSEMQWKGLQSVGTCFRGDTKVTKA